MDNVANSCLNCAIIHSTENYRNKNRFLQYSFSNHLLDNGRNTYGFIEKVLFCIADDHFTNELKLEFMKKGNSKRNFILEVFVIYWHGCLAKIQRDRGRSYVLDVILSFCESFGIFQKVTAINHPQSNEKAERVLQNLKSCIRYCQVASRED